MARIGMEKVSSWMGGIVLCDVFHYSVLLTCVVCEVVVTGRSDNEGTPYTTTSEFSDVTLLAQKKPRGQGWYARMSEEKRAEYLLKQRQAHQRKRDAAKSENNDSVAALVTPGITRNSITPGIAHNSITPGITRNSILLYSYKYIYNSSCSN